MHKGHLDQNRKNQRSTKPKLPTTIIDTTNIETTNIDTPTKPAPSTAEVDIELDLTAPTDMPPSSLRTSYIFAACEPISGVISSDPTGRFILPSSTGNSYILVVYDYDSNMIFAEPMKSRSASDHLSAYKKVHTTLSTHGLKPRLQRLDNEASSLLKEFLTENNIDFQLAPPQVHRRNQAERAIRVFKNHFIAGLCSTDPLFPLHLWDRLLPQALITLNLLRSAHINPKLSAQAIVFGPFDFNRTPMAPPGTKVIIHEKPSVRETWAPHGIDGWYLGPALNHYRCYRVYATETKAERIVDTLAWLPSQVKMPTASSSEIIIAAANDIIHALHHPSPATALSPLSDSELTALLQLADIFSNRNEQSKPTTDAPTIPPGFEQQQSAIEPRVPQQHPPQEPRVPSVTFQTPNNDTTIPTTTSTYQSTTGNPAQRRRRNRQSQKSKQLTSTTPTTNNPVPLPATTPSTNTPVSILKTPTIIPTTTTTTPIQPPSPATTTTHRHNTRYRSLSLAADHLLALSIFGPAYNTPTQQQTFVCAVTDSITGETLEYRHLIKGVDAHHWLKGWCNEFRRLGPKGTKTINVIAYEDIPKDRVIGNARIVAALKPNKAEKYRVRFTVAHHHHDYTGPTSTPTVDMPTVKCHFNSTISTLEARYATIDISDFYLNTPMTRSEFMRIPVKMIPEEIMIEYDLAKYIHNGYVYFEITKGLYGLVQAGKLAYDQLLRRLTAASFYPAPNTPGLFLHSTRPISFTLCVDDFGIKYTRQEDLDYLIDTLQKDYKITIDLTGSKYLGLTLDWDYDNRTVDISMPGYIENALQRFQHQPPSRPQHSPHSWTAPTYGAATQLAIDDDNTPPLSTENTNLLQQIIGTLLYYARAIDNTMLVAISTISAVQSRGTEATMDAAIQLLNYCATHPDAVIRYSASDMILHVHSDASYLSVHGARSRIGGYFFLSSTPPTNGYTSDSIVPPFNGPIHIKSSIMQHVMSSAAEAELGALFHNAKDGEMIRTVLESLGHKQPPTPIQTDNACAAGIVNNTVKQRRSRAMDMRFYWVRDRIAQGHFHVYWAPGETNDADYFTKHHPTSHHRVVRPRYLHDPASTHAAMQGCVDLSAPALLMSGTRSPSSHHTFSSISVPADWLASSLIAPSLICSAPVQLPNR